MVTSEEINLEPLFETTTQYTYSEIKRYHCFVLNHIMHYYLRLIVSVLSLAALGVIVMLCGLPEIGVMIIIGSAAGVLIRITVSCVNTPKQLMKSPMLDKTVNQRFYEDRITQEHGSNHTEYLFSSIKRVYETERNFYILIDTVGGIIIAKANCSEQLSAFIRELERNLQKDKRSGKK